MMRTRAIFGTALCKLWRQSSILMVPFGTVSAVIYERFCFRSYCYAGTTTHTF